MNPHATPLILVWTAGGIIALLVAALNYWDAASDGRRMKREGRNGLIALAAADERQAELFRILVATSFVLAGILAAAGGHPDWVIFYLVLGLVSIGLSSVRARWNRKAQLAYSERQLLLEHAAAMAAGRMPSRAVDDVGS